MKSFHIKGLRRLFAASVATGYFLTNAAFLHAAEANIWAERRKASAPQTASLPAAKLAADPSQILKGLPDLKITLSPSTLDRLKSDVPASILERHGALLRAIPPAYATIRKMSVPAGGARGPVVVFLQDVHKNDEAQGNLARTVAALSSHASLVGLEAAFSPMDFKAYREFRDQDAVRMAADHMLKEHEISGPVHTALTHQGAIPPFIGVDDLAHYEANIEAYRRASPAMGEATYRTAGLGRALDREKSKVFNGELLSFDRAVGSYRRGQLPFGDFAEALASRGWKGEGLEQFLQALKMEKSLDFKKVESERARVIEALVSRLGKGEMEHLLELSLSYRAGNLSHADYYQALKGICRANGADLSKYPAMDAYVRYVTLAEKVDADKLLKELRAGEKSIYERLSKTPAEKALVERTRRQVLTAKLVDFSLTPDEWEEYRTGRGEPLGIDLRPFESFYEEAEARNQAMTEKLLAAAPKGEKAAVLVAGGFHTTGMSKLLTARGATVIEVAPKLTRVDGSGSAYLSVFTQEKSPLEEIFKGNKLFVGDRPGKGLQTRGPAEVAMATEAGPKAGDIKRDYRALEGEGDLEKVRSQNGRVQVTASTPKGRVRLALVVAGGAIAAFSAAKVVGLRERAVETAAEGVSQGISLGASLQGLGSLWTGGLGVILAYIAIAVVLAAVLKVVLNSSPRQLARGAGRMAQAIALVLALAHCSRSETVDTNVPNAPDAGESSGVAGQEGSAGQIGLPGTAGVGGMAGAGQSGTGGVGGMAGAGQSGTGGVGGMAGTGQAGRGGVGGMAGTLGVAGEGNAGSGGTWVDPGSIMCPLDGETITPARPYSGGRIISSGGILSYSGVAINFIDTGNGASGIYEGFGSNYSASGGNLFVAAAFGELHFVDISDVTAPELKDTATLQSPEAFYSVLSQGNKVYAISGPSGPTQPTQTSQFYLRVYDVSSGKLMPAGSVLMQLPEEPTPTGQVGATNIMSLDDGNLLVAVGPIGPRGLLARISLSDLSIHPIGDYPEMFDTNTYVSRMVVEGSIIHLTDAHHTSGGFSAGKLTLYDVIAGKTVGTFPWSDRWINGLAVVRHGAAVYDYLAGINNTIVRASADGVDFSSPQEVGVFVINDASGNYKDIRDLTTDSQNPGILRGVTSEGILIAINICDPENPVLLTEGLTLEFHKTSGTNLFLGSVARGGGAAGRGIFWSLAFVVSFLLGARRRASAKRRLDEATSALSTQRRRRQPLFLSALISLSLALCQACGGTAEQVPVRSAGGEVATLDITQPPASIDQKYSTDVLMEGKKRLGVFSNDDSSDWDFRKRAMMNNLVQREQQRGTANPIFYASFVLWSLSRGSDKWNESLSIFPYRDIIDYSRISIFPYVGIQEFMDWHRLGKMEEMLRTLEPYVRAAGGEESVRALRAGTDWMAQVTKTLDSLEMPKGLREVKHTQVGDLEKFIKDQSGSAKILYNRLILEHNRAVFGEGSVPDEVPEDLMSSEFESFLRHFTTANLGEGTARLIRSTDDELARAAFIVGAAALVGKVDQILGPQSAVEREASSVQIALVTSALQGLGDDDRRKALLIMAAYNKGQKDPGLAKLLLARPVVDPAAVETFIKTYDEDKFQDVFDYVADEIIGDRAEAERAWAPIGAALKQALELTGKPSKTAARPKPAAAPARIPGAMPAPELRGKGLSTALAIAEGRGNQRSWLSWAVRVGVMLAGLSAVSPLKAQGIAAAKTVAHSPAADMVRGVGTPAGLSDWALSASMGQFLLSGLAVALLALTVFLLMRRGAAISAGRRRQGALATMAVVASLSSLNAAGCGGSAQHTVQDPSSIEAKSRPLPAGVKPFGDSITIDGKFRMRRDFLLNRIESRWGGYDVDVQYDIFYAAKALSSLITGEKEIKANFFYGDSIGNDAYIFDAFIHLSGTGRLGDATRVLEGFVEEDAGDAGLEAFRRGMAWLEKAVELKPVQEAVRQVSSESEQVQTAQSFLMKLDDISRPLIIRLILYRNAEIYGTDDALPRGRTIPYSISDEEVALFLSHYEPAQVAATATRVEERWGIWKEGGYLSMLSPSLKKIEQILGLRWEASAADVQKVVDAYNALPVGDRGRASIFLFGYRSYLENKSTEMLGLYALATVDLEEKDKASVKEFLEDYDPAKFQEYFDAYTKGALYTTPDEYKRVWSSIQKVVDEIMKARSVQSTAPVPTQPATPAPSNYRQGGRSVSSLPAGLTKESAALLPSRRRVIGRLLSGATIVGGVALSLTSFGRSRAAAQDDFPTGDLPLPVTWGADPAAEPAREAAQAADPFQSVQDAFDFLPDGSGMVLLVVSLFLIVVFLFRTHRWEDFLSPKMIVEGREEGLSIVREHLEEIRQRGEMADTIVMTGYWERIFLQAGRPDLWPLVSEEVFWALNQSWGTLSYRQGSLSYENIPQFVDAFLKLLDEELASYDTGSSAAPSDLKLLARMYGVLGSMLESFREDLIDGEAGMNSPSFWEESAGMSRDDAQRAAEYYIEARSRAYKHFSDNVALDQRFLEQVFRELNNMLEALSAQESGDRGSRRRMPPGTLMALLAGAGTLSLTLKGSAQTVGKAAQAGAQAAHPSTMRVGDWLSAVTADQPVWVGFVLGIGLLMFYWSVRNLMRGEYSYQTTFWKGRQWAGLLFFQGMAFLYFSHLLGWGTLPTAALGFAIVALQAWDLFSGVVRVAIWNRRITQLVQSEQPRDPAGWNVLDPAPMLALARRIQEDRHMHSRSPFRPSWSDPADNLLRRLYWEWTRKESQMEGEDAPSAAQRRAQLAALSSPSVLDEEAALKVLKGLEDSFSAMELQRIPLPEADRHLAVRILMGLSGTLPKEVFNEWVEELSDSRLSMPRGGLLRTLALWDELLSPKLARLSIPNLSVDLRKNVAAAQSYSVGHVKLVQRSMTERFFDRYPMERAYMGPRDAWGDVQFVARTVGRDELALLAHDMAQISFVLRDAQGMMVDRWSHPRMFAWLELSNDLREAPSWRGQHETALMAGAALGSTHAGKAAQEAALHDDIQAAGVTAVSDGSLPRVAPRDIPLLAIEELHRSKKAEPAEPVEEEDPASGNGGITAVIALLAGTGTLAYSLKGGAQPLQEAGGTAAQAGAQAVQAGAQAAQAGGISAGALVGWGIVALLAAALVVVVVKNWPRILDWMSQRFGRASVRITGPALAGFLAAAAATMPAASAGASLPSDIRAVTAQTALEAMAHRGTSVDVRHYLESLPADETAGAAALEEVNSPLVRNNRLFLEGVGNTLKSLGVTVTSKGEADRLVARMAGQSAPASEMLSAGGKVLAQVVVARSADDLQGLVRQWEGQEGAKGFVRVLTNDSVTEADVAAAFASFTGGLQISIGRPEKKDANGQVRPLIPAAGEESGLSKSELIAPVESWLEEEGLKRGEVSLQVADAEDLDIANDLTRGNFFAEWDTVWWEFDPASALKRAWKVSQRVLDGVGARLLAEAIMRAMA